MKKLVVAVVMVAAVGAAATGYQFYNDGGRFTALNELYDPGNYDGVKSFRHIVKRMAADALASDWDLNDTDKKGATLLHWAAWAGLPDVVQRLIWAGADVNARNKEGYTPLLHASSPEYGVTDQESTEVIRLLIEAGANVNANPGSWSAIIAGTFFLQMEAFQMLLDNGANVNANYKGMRPIHGAARTNIEKVKLLLAKGAEVNVAYKGGNTPLHVAAGSGKPEIILALLEAGADLHTKTDELATALHRAAVSNDDRGAAVVAVLLEAGADVAALDADGMTPLQLARREGNEKAAELLQEAEAAAR